MKADKKMPLADNQMLKADKDKLGYIGAKPGKTQRDSDAWFTPSYYIELSKMVLGNIDLDPFSSAAANKIVQATRFFDLETNAFKQQWFKKAGTVFMNPPYSRSLINLSVEVFIDNFRQKYISEAIVLVNNATETKWFQLLLQNTSSACFVSKRISFVSVDGKNISGNTRGQVFFYFGSNCKRFKSVFSNIGTIMYH